MHKIPHALTNGRFASVCSVDEFILEQENKSTAHKTERNVLKIVQRFLNTKDENMKIEDISAVELNKYISQFIISVRTKNGTEYESNSLRSLIATTLEENGLFCQHNQRLGSSIQAKTAKLRSKEKGINPAHR